MAENGDPAGAGVSDCNGGAWPGMRGSVAGRDGLEAMRLLAGRQTSRKTGRQEGQVSNTKQKETEKTS